MNNSNSRYTISSPFLVFEQSPMPHYTMSSSVPVVGEKRYVLPIRDVPSEDKPREKLIAQGASTLAPHELLAVLFGTGSKKEDVLSMTARIVKDYGEKNIFSQTDAHTLAKDLDIPVIKAAQIVAAGELGRRFFGRSKNGAPIIRTAREVYEYVADMRTLQKEHLRGIYLNSHYQVVHDEVISIGTVDANIVHPREVFRPALASNAAAVILVHNHPSGILAASSEDVAITRQIAEAGRLIGIELVDHVIVTRDGYVSVQV